MSFITSAARNSFEHLLCSALKAHIGVQTDDVISVEPSTAPKAKGEKPRKLVLLTCASLRFKLVVVFQVVNEALAEAYFGGQDGSADPIEVLSEHANLCCGALNRELLPYTPHVGLSTPSLLVNHASKMLAALQGEHVSHFAVHANGDHLLDVSLCMHGNAKVDFMADTSIAMAETGELELL